MGVPQHDEKTAAKTGHESEENDDGLEAPTYTTVERTAVLCMEWRKHKARYR